MVNKKVKGGGKAKGPAKSSNKRQVWQAAFSACHYEAFLRALHISPLH